MDNASKEDITRLEKKIDELKVGRDEHDNLPDNSGKILKNYSSRRVSVQFGQIQLNSGNSNSEGKRKTITLARNSSYRGKF